MLVPRMDGIPQDPAIPVTGSLYGIGRDVFVFPFPKPATLWVCRTIFTGLFLIPTGAPAGWWVIAVFIF